MTIRLVGSDDLPETANREAADITACLEAGALRPRVGVRYPLERSADAHVVVESGRSSGRVVLDIA